MIEGWLKIAATTGHRRSKHTQKTTIQRLERMHPTMHTVCMENKAGATSKIERGVLLMSDFSKPRKLPASFTGEV